MKAKKVLAGFLCAAMTLGMTVPAMAEESGDAEYAMILKTQATDFWVKMWKGIEDEAEAKGVKVDLYAAQSEEDLEGQLTILESCISKGYKGIGIAPLSSVNVLPGIGEATEKGITIVDIDEKFDEQELENQGGATVAYVATDNVAVGNKGGQFIVDNVDEGAQVAIIEGKSGNQSSEDRAEGARKAFEDAGLDIIGSQAADWDRQTALDIATTYIQQNPDLKGIYCCNDGMALGAIQAVINADKVGEILVVGTDGDTEAVESIAAEQLSATVAQDPAQIGATSLDLLIDAVENGTEAKVGEFPEKTPIDSVLITAENAADYQ
nr:D-allose transporter substrate-binding protein [uncultured Blautia sp.]